MTAPDQLATLNSPLPIERRPHMTVPAPEFVKAVEAGSANVSAVAEIATLPTCTLFIIKLSRFWTLLLPATVRPDNGGKRRANGAQEGAPAQRNKRP
jgi:hypothetical protein